MGSRKLRSRSVASKRKRSRNFSELGASMLEMGLLISLIAIAALLSVQSAGKETTSALCRAYPIIADMNGDGYTSIFDLDFLTGNWGSTSVSTKLEGDLNCDFKVDFEDFRIYQQNFGEPF